MFMPVLMDFGAAGGVKAEKAMAMRRYRRISQIATFLRCAEVVAVLALLLWSSSRLPDAIRLFAVFLRRLASLLISTPFVFLLGNAIVLTLFAKSKHQHPSDAVSTSSDHHSIYDEFLRAAADVHNNNRGIPPPPAQQHLQIRAATEVVYEDKAVCLVEAGPERRRFRRTKSEHVMEKHGDRAEKLRRTTTDVLGKKNIEDDEFVAAVPVEMEEEKETTTTTTMTTMMSNEELRRRVEAFIAKEIRFRREESIAMVIAGGSGDQQE